MKTVCCLIVTYNRSKYLAKLLESLSSQNYAIQSYVIINNNSTDDTIEYLDSKGYIKKDDLKVDDYAISYYNEKKIYFYNSSINMGGSGGFAKAFEIANLLNYDLFWVMDDDIVPRVDCLNKLVINIDDEHKIVVPRRIGEGFYDPIIVKYRFSNPFVHLFLDRSKTQKQINNSYYDVKTFTFEGPLISKSIINKVGIPNKDYFLQGDDYDYAFRCLKYTKIKYIVESIIDRQLPFVNTKITEGNYWRLYYSLRNASLLDLRYAKYKILGKLRVKSNKIRWFLINFKHKNKFERKIVKRAFYDALHGIDGITIKPGEC